MRRNTCVKSAYNFVKYILLFALTALIFVILYGVETILLIYHSPYCWTIVTSKGLNVSVKIKILSLIILLIFYMPYPCQRTIFLFSLITPKIKASAQLLFYLVSFNPIERYVFLIAPTNSTAFGFTYFISDI